jgi:hypothetical protein
VSKSRTKKAFSIFGPTHQVKEESGEKGIGRELGGSELSKD